MNKQVDQGAIDGLSDLEALNLVAELVNRASDTGDLSLCDQAFEIADAIEARGVVDENLAILDYFRANAWDCRYAKRLGNRAEIWDWDQPEVEQQVFLLRRALNSIAFDGLHQMYRCQILTNLANQLDKLGRFVEAQALWTRALAIDPNFWMASANRGNGLMYYVRALYEDRDRAVLMLHAHRDLTDAVDLISRHPNLGDTNLAGYFASNASEIAAAANLPAIRRMHDPEAGSLGDTPEERAYRRWCLDNVLFLDPINDVERMPVCAGDPIGLPAFTTELDEAPVVIGMANELKQSYASARWLLWDGLQAGEVHFSDRRVRLYNTLDYPCHSLAVEKTKLAFRMAYSILDKIAYFLNHYGGLGIPEKKVGFRTIWREKEGGPIRERFLKSENLPWRGLFWLGKDLFDERMRDTTEPDAQALAELRNHLEHKYVKVTEYGPRDAAAGGPLHDGLAHTISRSDLERRSLRLVQLVRAALIYLFLGMHREEMGRARGAAGGGNGAKFTVPMPLDVWEDDWKM